MTRSKFLMISKQRGKEQGFVLITTLLMLVVLVALMGAYAMTSHIELVTTKLSRRSTSGFYTSEAGLNIRAESIRNTFLGYNRPTGTSPSAVNPCSDGNMGSGDFACVSYPLGTRTARTYIEEDPGNPVILTVPQGERYQNLNAQEYRYTAKSFGLNPDGSVEALLELRFKSRLVPLFQFAAFYNKDLEILPGPAMTLSGPIHTNGDLYLNTDTGPFTVNGQITTADDMYRGRKNTSACNSTQVQIYNPLNPVALYPTCPTRRLITAADVAPYNNMIQLDVEPVTVPGPEVLDPTPGQVYWDKADLRLVLRLTGAGAIDTTNAPTGIEVRNSDNSVNVAATTTLNSTALCPGSLGGRLIGSTNPTSDTGTFYNSREGKRMRLMDIELKRLFNCLHTNNWFGTGKLLSDDTEGGLVFFFTIEGPQSSSTANSYGIRLRDADRLYSDQGGAPAIKGLTVVSNQAAYTYGHYNRTNKIPAAILCDSFNVLSTNWLDSNSWVWDTTAHVWMPGALTNIGHGHLGRRATNTTVNTAVLAGTDTTGGIDGEGGQGGAYNGGLENYPRFHEDWSGGRVMTYAGSWVSLGKPLHVTGSWASQSYNPPSRAWSYETSFNNAANLPPITPRFVYLRQELFVRDYEQE